MSNLLILAMNFNIFATLQYVQKPLCWKCVFARSSQCQVLHIFTMIFEDVVTLSASGIFLCRCCPNRICFNFISFKCIFDIGVESLEIWCAKPMFPLQPGRIFHNSIKISFEICLFIEN